jgi:uncharacterized Zn-binding protein involved in type VI secretion
MKAGRVQDLGFNPIDVHGCPACPHPVIGPAMAGSGDVYIEGLNALRIGDPGVHAVCCGPNVWAALTGSETVYVNNIAHHRQYDLQVHCGGIGYLCTGSPTVDVG